MTWYRDLWDRATGQGEYASVTVIPVGRSDDGLEAMWTGGTSFDRPWVEHKGDMGDARLAWENNPMVRRLVGLISAYVVGPGFTPTSEKKSFKKMIEEFWVDPQNNMDLRLAEWCDELSRAGEIFPVLFSDPSTGRSIVRIVPADLIEKIDYNPDDYETELRFKESSDPGTEKWWKGVDHPEVNEVRADGKYPPMMLHYAINRPIGRVRGTGDLYAILPWIRRYERWLEDRVSLNAAMRSFYWIVYGSKGIMDRLRNQYSRPPKPGAIIIAQDGAERWDAVTPNLNARDAKEDGRAIRWMVASGGPGTALADFGESEESGLTKGKDGDELRRRFLLRRQRYFVYIVSDILVQAYNRQVAIKGNRFDPVDVGHVRVTPPDIAPEDNETLATAASVLTTSLTELQGMIGYTDDFKHWALKLYIKFVGENLAEEEIGALLKGDPFDDTERGLKLIADNAPAPAPAQPTKSTKKEGSK